MLLKDKVLKALDFLRITDETGALSLTNITMIIVMVHMALIQDCNIGDAASLLTAMSGYGFKRFYQRKQRYGKENVPSPLEVPGASDLLELRQDLDRMKMAINLKDLTNGKNNSRT